MTDLLEAVTPTAGRTRRSVALAGTPATRRRPAPDSPTPTRRPRRRPRRPRSASALPPPTTSWPRSPTAMPTVRRRAVTVAVAPPRRRPAARARTTPTRRSSRSRPGRAASASGERRGRAPPRRPGETATVDPLVRESSVAALGAIGDDRGLDAILGATTDKPAIRRRAVLALAPFLDPDHPRADDVAAALRAAPSAIATGRCARPPRTSSRGD